MAISVPPELATGAAARSLASLSDTELVVEVRRGSDRAFEHLYERYHRRIAAYIYGMVGDYGRAEDVAQDVFMSALRRMRATDRPIAFKAWVYEIAKNACIDQFRRTRRTEEVSIDADAGLAAADHRRLVTTGPGPDAAVEQKLALDDLCGAFGGLSRTHHEILVMRELEGFSYRQIGEKLGMSRASVESTLFRARRRLGEEYAELVSGERCRRVQGIVVTAVETAALGARDQRRLSAHLSHCQACRRQARLTGLDPSLLVAPRGARAKIAALIPLPGFLRRRWGGEAVGPLTHDPRLAAIARMSAQAGVAADPSLASWGRAAAAAGALAVAGVAGGAAAEDHSRTWSGRPVAPVWAPPAAQAPAVTPPRSTAGGTAAPPGAAATPGRSVRPANAGTASPPVSGAPSGSPASSGGPAAGAEAPAGAAVAATAAARAPVTRALDRVGAPAGGQAQVPDVTRAPTARDATTTATEAAAAVTSGAPSTKVQPTADAAAAAAGAVVGDPAAEAAAVPGAATGSVPGG